MWLRKIPYEKAMISICNSEPQTHTHTHTHTEKVDHAKGVLLEKVNTIQDEPVSKGKYLIFQTIR